MAKELYVGHLSELVTEEDVWKLFSVMGTVTSVHLIIDPETGEFKRCGYVRMAAGVNLEEVAESLDGTYLIDKIITVSIARPQIPGMSKNKTPKNKPWLKPGPKPPKDGAKPGTRSTADRARSPKAKPAAAASEGPKNAPSFDQRPKTRTGAASAAGPRTAATREQRPKTRTDAPSSAGPARGKRPGAGTRTPRAGK
ncbi:MAG: RNA-binding protein [Desulfuromonadales bacterium]|nr:RNA-binding protein [Desulfuromonadales bacterium]